eukprot:2085180-Pyramimonas_sp.AAC.1
MGPTDPAISTAMDVINSWALSLATSNVERKPIESTWARTVKGFSARPQHAWSHHVWGICSATVCLLLWYSWEPRGPWRWVSPDGIEFFAPPEKHAVRDLDFSDLKHVFSLSVQRSLWTAAAEEYLGRGLDQGIPDLGPLRKFLRSLKRKGEFALFGIHQAIATGNLWPAQRVHECFPEADPICPRCKEVPETPRHAHWECPRNASLEGVAPRAAIDRAIHDCDELPCFWHRGIAPGSWVEVDPPNDDPPLLDLSLSTSEAEFRSGV